MSKLLNNGPPENVAWPYTVLVVLAASALVILTENDFQSRVSCSFSAAVLLFLLAVAAVFVCAFASYWYTRQEYEMKLAGIYYAPQPRRNMQVLHMLRRKHDPVPRAPRSHDLKKKCHLALEPLTDTG